MSFSTYEATAPILLRSLHKLSALLDKGAASGVPEADLLAARIAPDMLPLTKQIQIISDTAKGAVARLTGVDAPSMPDTEACLVDLKARIAIAYALLRMKGVQIGKADFLPVDPSAVTFPT